MAGKKCSVSSFDKKRQLKTCSPHNKYRLVLRKFFKIIHWHPHPPFPHPESLRFSFRRILDPPLVYVTLFFLLNIPKHFLTNISLVCDTDTILFQWGESRTFLMRISVTCLCYGTLNILGVFITWPTLSQIYI